MSEQLNDVLVSAAKDFIQNLTSVKSFVLAQAPDVLQQMILQARITLTIAIIVGVLLILIGFTCSYLLYKYKFPEPTWFIPALVGFVLGFMFLISSFGNFITAWFAPKVYLLEHLRNMF